MGTTTSKEFVKQTRGRNPLLGRFPELSKVELRRRGRGYRGMEGVGAMDDGASGSPKRTVSDVLERKRKTDGCTCGEYVE